jgi:arsenate reductase
MGCGDACPILPSTRYEDWTSTDPAGLDLERRVHTLLGQLENPTRKP